jgi:hypothetical protein
MNLSTFGGGDLEEKYMSAEGFDRAFGYLLGILGEIFNSAVKGADWLYPAAVSLQWTTYRYYGLKLTGRAGH